MRPLRRLLEYYRPYLKSFSAGLILVVVSMALASLVPWLLRRGLDAIAREEPMDEIVRVTAAIAATALTTGLFRYWMRELLNGVSRRIEFDLRNDLFASVMRLDASWYAATRTGDIIARLTNDVGAVRMAAGPAVMYLVNTVAGGLFALAFMLAISIPLTAMSLLPMVLLPVIGLRLGRLVHDRFDAVQEHFSTMTTRAQENITGARIVRAYRQERAETARFAALSDEYVRRNMALVRLWGTMHPLFALLAGLATAIVLGAGGVLTMRGSISVGSFVAFGLYLAMLTWPLIALGWVVNLFQRGSASMRRLLEILDAKPGVTDAGKEPLPDASGGRRIEYRNVSFHYPAPPGHPPRWVLRDVSFRVEAGETLAIVGATGSGKTALLDLLPRVYDPQEGTILVDDVPIREVPLAELRRTLAYVPQETVLFSETIAANLGYAGRDEQDWRSAARVAQLDDTISGFPGGYETLLGERGINLSGGQKQRVAIARALARNAGVLLMDDALSAVDTHTEADILRGLGAALRNRTALIASHRVSAVRDADRIIVLREGTIVETGSHAELMAARGEYWSLVQRQQLVDAIEDPTELASGPPSGTIAGANV
ncbi:MAG TPA: ABC transporter ATP-binding protein [Gemmatimonadaceae bacterium]